MNSSPVRRNRCQADFGRPLREFYHPGWGAKAFGAGDFLSPDGSRFVIAVSSVYNELSSRQSREAEWLSTGQVKCPDFPLNSDQPGKTAVSQHVVSS
jgi:hypothetical protein